MSQKTVSSSSPLSLQLVSAFVSGAVTICAVQYVARKYNSYVHRPRKTVTPDDRTNGTSF